MNKLQLLTLILFVLSISSTDLFASKTNCRPHAKALDKEAKELRDSGWGFYQASLKASSQNAETACFNYCKTTIDKHIRSNPRWALEKWDATKSDVSKPFGIMYSCTYLTDPKVLRSGKNIFLKIVPYE